MIMSGSLAEWSVEDLLHLVRITQKTTSIRLIGASRRGAVHLSHGAIVAVEVDPSPGDAGDDFSRAVDGIRAFTGLVEGTFEFCSPDFVDSGARFDIEHILAAVAKDIRREQRLQDLGISNDQPLGLTDRPAGPVAFQVQAWQLLAPLVPAFSLDHLDARFGRGRAVATVLMLDALGVLERRPLTDEPDVADGLPVEVTGGAMTAPPPEPSEISGGEAETAAPPESPSVEEAPMPYAQVERFPDDPHIGEPPRAALVPLGDAGDTLGAHYVEIFDHPSRPASGTPDGDLTLVSGVLNDIRSRFRTGPSQIDAGFPADE
jgi:hypothetical protein